MADLGAVQKLIIIGSGPAGYTAAIYAGRALLKPLLFSGQEPGGQLTTTTDVENYPGFPGGIQGPELMAKFRAQAARFETEIIDAAVERVDFTAKPFKVWSGEKEFYAESVVVATGSSSLWLGIPSEQKLRGKGVSSCATCDGFFFKGKDIYDSFSHKGNRKLILKKPRFVFDVSFDHKENLLKQAEFLGIYKKTIQIFEKLYYF